MTWIPTVKSRSRDCYPPYVVVPCMTILWSWIDEDVLKNSVGKGDVFAVEGEKSGALTRCAGDWDIYMYGSPR